MGSYSIQTTIHGANRLRCYLSIIFYHCRTIDHTVVLHISQLRQKTKKSIRYTDTGCELLIHSNSGEYIYGVPRNSGNPCGWAYGKYEWDIDILSNKLKAHLNSCRFGAVLRFYLRGGI